MRRIVAGQSLSQDLFLAGAGKIFPHHEICITSLITSRRRAVGSSGSSEWHLWGN